MRRHFSELFTAMRARRGRRGYTGCSEIGVRHFIGRSHDRKREEKFISAGMPLRRLKSFTYDAVSVFFSEGLVTGVSICIRFIVNSLISLVGLNFQGITMKPKKKNG